MLLFSQNPAKHFFTFCRRKISSFKKQVFFLYGLFPYAFFLHTAPKKAKKRSLGAIARASYHPLFYINL